MTNEFKKKEEGWIVKIGKNETFFESFDEAVNFKDKIKAIMPDVRLYYLSEVIETEGKKLISEQQFLDAVKKWERDGKQTEASAIWGYLK